MDLNNTLKTTSIHKHQLVVEVFLQPLIESV